MLAHVMHRRKKISEEHRCLSSHWDRVIYLWNKFRTDKLHHKATAMRSALITRIDSAIYYYYNALL